MTALIASYASTYIATRPRRLTGLFIIGNFAFFSALLAAMFYLRMKSDDWPVPFHFASLLMVCALTMFALCASVTAIIGAGVLSLPAAMVPLGYAGGSICFLVSSYLSYAEVCHGAARWQPAQLSWWITVGNLVGSLAFGVSAFASKVLTDGELRSSSCTTFGTFIGGICFLGASILLLPERTADMATPAVASST